LSFLISPKVGRGFMILIRRLLRVVRRLYLTSSRAEQVDSVNPLAIHTHWH